MINFVITLVQTYKDHKEPLSISLSPLSLQETSTCHILNYGLFYFSGQLKYTRFLSVNICSNCCACLWQPWRKAYRHHLNVRCKATFITHICSILTILLLNYCLHTEALALWVYDYYSKGPDLLYVSKCISCSPSGCDTPQLPSSWPPWMRRHQLGGSWTPVQQLSVQRI